MRSRRLKNFILAKSVLILASFAGGFKREIRPEKIDSFSSFFDSTVWDQLNDPKFKLIKIINKLIAATPTKIWIKALVGTIVHIPLYVASYLYAFRDWNKKEISQ